MEHELLTKRGSTLQVKFVNICRNEHYSAKSSSEFVIGGVAVFQMRIVTSYYNKNYNSVNNSLVFMRFFKQQPNEPLNYNIKFTCDEFAIKDKCFISDDGSWRLIHEDNKTFTTFNVSVVMDVVLTANSFTPLHEDEESTDFELRGEDGTIRVHRFVLSAASPVLRRMLCGPWRETTQGHVEVPETSKATIQHLKNYMYSYMLPEDGIEQLLLLASFYMMPELEQKCVNKLVQNLTAQNACDLLKFAVKNDVTRLLFAILASVRNGEVEVKDMWCHVNSANQLRLNSHGSGSGCKRPASTLVTPKAGARPRAVARGPKRLSTAGRGRLSSN